MFGGSPVTAVVSQQEHIITQMPDSQADRLVLRHAPGWDGAVDPSRDDIRRVLHDIESDECERPEFTIENLNNCQPAEVDGQRVLQCTHRGSTAFAATHYQENGTVLWYITYWDGADTRLALSNGCQDGRFIGGILCGGPFALRSDCGVTQDMALDVLDYFVCHRAPSSDHQWIPESDSYDLD